MLPYLGQDQISVEVAEQYDLGTTQQQRSAMAEAHQVQFSLVSI